MKLLDIADQLKTQVLEHREFSRVLNLLLAKIAHDHSTGFALCVGITGVGKTTLLGRLLYLLTEQAAKHPEKGLSEPIALTLVEPERKPFSWPDFYRFTLSTELNIPFLEQRRNLEKAIRTYVEEGVKKQIKAQTIADLRRLFIETTNSRRCIALLIDEIQALCKVSNNVDAHDNLDVIKSLSDLIEVPVICFGTSAAYEMLYKNEQTSRRADMIHFQRYGMSSTDMEEFASVVHHIEHSLNVPFHSGVLDDIEYIYAHSLGCVGILMDWVKMSIALAIENGHSSICKSEFREKALSSLQLRSIADRIKSVDQLFEDSESFNAIDYLGREGGVFGKSTPGKTGNSSPGKRKQITDPTGGLQEEMSLELG